MRYCAGAVCELREFRGDFNGLSASVCELNMLTVLDMRREVEKIWSFVCELKGSSVQLVTTQDVEGRTAADNV